MCVWGGGGGGRGDGEGVGRGGSWEILDDKFWILYLPRIFTHLTLYLVPVIKFTFNLLPVNVSKIAG